MRNDSKARDIFYGIVAVATLIVAIIGATLAYFSMTASSNEGAINATAAIVSVEYSDGQQVTAQADALIPATLDVVQKVYNTHIASAGVQENLEKVGNMCTDKNGKQVCSVYRFSIRSDTSRTIIAYLNNEHNGFKYLSYAVYDVTSNSWIQLTEEGAYNITLDTCDNENENTELHCYKDDGTEKIYTKGNQTTAINSIFGYQGNNDAGQLVGGEKEEQKVKTYDLVLFIEENDQNQNSEQGKNYRGTIMVEIQDGGEYGNGHITGVAD